jgi:protein-L-isoaspartate(D-aspartate) O-methyltransferase
LQYGIATKFSFLFNESLITRARNYLVDEFLHRSDCTHMLFLDSDISFDPKDVIALLALDKDVIGGPYPKKAIKWANIKKAIVKNPNIEEGILEKLAGDFVFNPVKGTQQFSVTEPLEVLEIGTGSGFQAAILASLGGRIYTIERVRALYLSSKSLLKEMKFSNIQSFYKDGYLGLPEFAPFDKIIVTAGAPEIPPLLPKQLSIGGIMLVPTGLETQRLLKIVRTGENSWETEDLGEAKFVPFLAGTRPS